MRSEGFSFNSAGLGVKFCSRLLVVATATIVNRPQPFAVALWRSHWAKLLDGVLDGSMTCQIRVKQQGNDVDVEHDFTAQRRFVRSAVFFAVTLGLAFGESCFWGVGCGMMWL